VDLVWGSYAQARTYNLDVVRRGKQSGTVNVILGSETSFLRSWRSIWLKN